MQTRCPHCQNAIEVVQDEVSFDCPSCGKSVQLADAQTIVQPEESAPISDTATLSLDGEISPAVIAETTAEQVHYFGDYELLEEIARGGMGVVYKARQVSLNRTVAVKMILAGQLAGEEDVRRFLTEAEAAANLQHPHIVAIHEVGEHKGQHFFSMDYVEGTDLSALIHDNPLPAREAADYVQRIASAIQYAHEQGTLHRDLKPSNILIDKQGEPHITDFGIAKRIAPAADDTEVFPGEGDSGRMGQQQEVAQLTATGAVLGTPSYMPPEQAGAKHGEIGPQSDVYSMGAILYCLLTGRPPFQAENPLSTMLQVLQQEPVSPRLLNTNVHRDLETICLKCLEKDPGRRYQSAGELVDELDCYLSGKPITARPISKLERSWRWCKRKPAVAGAGILAVILLLVLGVGGPMIALQQSTLRARADQQAQRADEAAEEAKANADQARWNLKMAERNSYNSDMLLVYRDWEETNISHLKELLDRYRNRDDLKGFEWGYWNRLVNSELFTLNGHLGAVYSVSFSPDGKRIVSGAIRDYAVKVWNAETGQETLTLKGHRGMVWSVSFSPDGQRILSGSGDIGRAGAIKVWDAETGQELFTLKGHSKEVRCVNFSRDGKRIVSGSADSTIKVWNVETVQETLTLKGHSNGVRCVNFSPDGKWIVSGGLKDSTVKVWDAETGQELFTLKGHSKEVRCVNFSRDGKRIVGFCNKTVKVWDTETGQEMHALTLKGNSIAFTGVSFSPDGKRIVGIGHKTVKVWDAETGQETLTLKGHSEPVNCVRFSPDGKRIVSGSGVFFGSRGEIKVWDAETGQEPLTLKGHTSNVWSVSFSPDGKRIVSSDGHPLKRTAQAKVWDADTGQETLTLIGHSRLISSAIFSPDGMRIVTGDHDSTIRVWDAATGQETLILKEGPVAVFWSVSFNPNGKRIVSGGGDSMVRVWDAETGQKKLTLKGHTSTVYSVSFSPDGKRIVSGATGVARKSDGNSFRHFGEVKVWDAETGQETLILKGHRDQVISVSFSPDGKRIVSGGGKLMLANVQSGEIKVWDAETGQETLTLKGHTGMVWSVSFSPDGQRIVSGSSDGTIRVWDATTGQEMLTLNGHTEVSCVSFSPDGSRIVSGGGDLTVKVWDARPLEKSR